MATDKPQNEWDKKELGALWKRKKQATGENYLSGMLNLKSLGFDKDVPVVIFSNKGKTKDNHPDLRIFVSEKRPTGTVPATTAPSTARTPAAKTAPAAAPVDNTELV